MPRRLAGLVCLIAIVLIGTAAAAPSNTNPCGVAPTFGSHMVLQRNKPVPIWGWASEAGQPITLTFNGQTKTATADAQKHWSITLDPMPAGGPFNITLDGKNVCDDVMIGDVWVCSGQSNMQFGIDKVDGLDHHAPEVIAQANHPMIRLWTVPRGPLAEKPLDTYHPQLPWEAKWMVCTPQNIAYGTWGGFSAVGYFFGRDLQQSQHIPIGLMMVAHGGTAIEAWLSPQVIPQIEHDGLRCPTLAQARADRTRDHKPAQRNFNSVSTCYNTLLHPLLPMAVRGVIWFQGETPGNDANYAPKLAALIADWRTRFADPDLPFIIAQLCNHRTRPGARGLEWVREAQANVVRDTPHTALAVTIDLADRDGQGPSQVHFKDKLDVGRRMALAARATVYGEKIPYSGPVFHSMKIDGPRVRLTFTHTDGGLALHGDHLNGFTLAGADHHFTPAQAKIDGDTVIVESASAPNPVAARYGYAAFVDPLCNLYNGAGLPAVPFRTDDWPNK